MRTFIGVLLVTMLFVTDAVSQNYIGYNREYIEKDMKSNKKDMKGPVTRKDDWNNYIAYFAKDGKRAVYYHFKKEEVTLPDGTTGPTDICYKYVSKTKCRNQLECPELDKVIRSLDSHFSKEGEDMWIDYSKPVPHQWVVVEQGDYFEVHVTEVKNKEKEKE